MRNVPEPSAVPTEADLEVAAELGAAVSRVVRVASRAKMEAASRGERIDVATFRLLVALDEAGPMRANALAGAVFSDPSTVSRQIGALVAAGHVERHPDPADRRASLLRLTEAGSAALTAHRRIRDEHIARVTAAWPVADRRRIAELLDRLADDLSNHLQPGSEPAVDLSGPALQERS